MLRDNKYNFNVGDIVYIPYMNDVPSGFYEVSSIKPLWIKDDDKGSFNSQHNNFGSIKLVAKAEDRKDV